MPAMPTPGFGLAEPAAQRLSALLYDRQPRRDPDPGAAPAQGPHPPGHQRVALPAAGGVHMEQGFVNDVCLTPRFNQCVFYEDELTRE